MSPEDIRDIRAPLDIPVWWYWPLAIALAALAALAIVLAIRWWQRRRAAKLTPLALARQALLVAEAHAHAGRTREWADVLAATLRTALASRIGASVLPQTTTELARADWAQRGAERAAHTYLAEAPRLLRLLVSCDLARFALASVGTEALLADTGVARNLIEALYAPPPKPKPAQLTLRSAPVTP